MRSVVLECHWRPALLWLLLLLICNSEALRDTSSSSRAMMGTVSVHPSTTTHPVPSSTATQIPPTTTPTAPPTTPPTPTMPPQHGPVLMHEHGVLYISIDDISVKFTGTGSEKFPHVNRSLLDSLGRLTAEVHNSANEIVFTQWFGTPPHNFSLKFDFSTNTSGDSMTWYIQSITHSNPNVSSDRNVLFVYQGVQYNVKAPLGYVYSCDKVKAVGYDLLDPAVLPALELRNITVQAFYNGKLSEKIHSCDGDNKESDNKQTGLIIGLVVGITVVLAIIVIAIATFVMKWKKKADYDLLD